MTRLRNAPARLSPISRRLQPSVTAGSGFARTDGLSSAQRGYGTDWRKVRASVLKAEPVCRICRTARATEVDHIQRFRGIDDPLRLDRANLRPVCVPCHRSRTARQAQPGGEG